MQPKMSRFLEEFKGFFKEPMSLPPKRDQNHAIRLIVGAQPLNICPYKYPYYQKYEIEKILKGMLVAEIIRPSMSPFLSLVLLVRKDKGWRFYVDYQTLNKITIPDKFPIPNIDKLLDELLGAAIFTNRTSNRDIIFK